MRTSRDEWGIQLAQVTARRGTCCRRQVGCVLVDADGHVIATGYNGVAAGQPHCNELKMVPNPKLLRPNGTYREPEHWEPAEVGVFAHPCPGGQAPSGTGLDACQAIHAEQNALLQCPNVRAIHTAYVTCSPCITCVKLLMNTGCQRIVFAEPYSHDQAARELWLSRNPQGLDTSEGRAQAALFGIFPEDAKYKWIHHQPETQS